MDFINKKWGKISTVMGISFFLGSVLWRFRFEGYLTDKCIIKNLFEINDSLCDTIEIEVQDVSN